MSIKPHEQWTVRVRERCKELGIRLQDLAPTLEVTTSGGVSHYLNGRQDLTVKQAYRLAARLRTSICWLLEGMEAGPVPIDSDLFSQDSTLMDQATSDIQRAIPKDVKTAALAYTYSELVEGRTPTQASIASMISFFIKSA